MKFILAIGYDGLKQQTTCMVQSMSPGNSVVFFNADPYLDLPTHKFIEALKICHDGLKQCEKTGQQVKIEGLIGQ